MSDTHPDQAVPDQPDTDDAANAENSVGDLVHRPAWLAATRVGALAGYVTIVGLAGAGSATCGSIGAGLL